MPWRRRLPLSHVPASLPASRTVHWRALESTQRTACSASTRGLSKPTVALPPEEEPMMFSPSLSTMKSLLPVPTSVHSMLGLSFPASAPRRPPRPAPARLPAARTPRPLLAVLAFFLVAPAILPHALGLWESLEFWAAPLVVGEDFFARGPLLPSATAVPPALLAPPDGALPVAAAHVMTPKGAIERHLRSPARGRGRPRAPSTFIVDVAETPKPTSIERAPAGRRMPMRRACAEKAGACPPATGRACNKLT
mmetsp:Transcript_71468/g.225714  ORF Transcript_71468/g.225714 Transcript_71468/m.225714 type:complete len:252 (-) Transcript_71468:167-922(-)